MSNEHVWPEWLKDVLPDLAAQDTSFHTGASIDPDTWEVHESTRVMPLTMLETRVRRPCRACNQGWMSGIEAAAKPVLTPLIVGEGRHLTVEDQRAIATWAYKTTAMTEFIYPRTRVIGAEQHRHLFQHRSPPMFTGVWIGSLDAPRGWEARSRHLTVGLGPQGMNPRQLRPNTHSTTIGLGRLLLLTLGTTVPDLLNYFWIVDQRSTDLLLDAGLRRVWPEQEEFEWDPASLELFDEDRAWELSELMVRPHTDGN